MKKYTLGILLIAGVALIGGLMIKGSLTAHASIACDPHNFNAGCAGGTYVNCAYAGTGPDTNGVIVETLNSPLCGAITVGNGSSGVWSTLDFVNSNAWSNSLYSMLYANALTWTDSNNNVVHPKKVTTQVNFYDKLNNQVYLVGGSPSKVAGIVNDFAAGRVVGGGTSPTQMVDNCHGVALGAVSGNSRCCVDNGGGSQSLYITPISDAACYALIIGHGTSTATTSAQ